jgi:ABC-type sugar transport system ATPase subunit
MTDAAIEAQGLTKSFGDVRALDGIDLRAPAVFGVLSVYKYRRPVSA